ncbi:M16 family metallopeptidase, partial [Shewanella sp. 0m-11]
MKRYTKALFLSLGLLMAMPMAQATEAKDIQSFTLGNGMKIMVLEDSSIPNANMYLFWKVGSRNEVPGITGISHFFEHMMFNGSKKYGPKMFDRTMEAAGGANNAYTTENLTVYTDWFPANALETIFDLEADRIENLDINEQMVESERGVVASERLTGLENSNWRVLQEELKGAAFRAHPYSWSVIGHESDIAAWTLEDLTQYHKTYYAPNNAVVVIAGDVKLSEVKKLADKYFAPIPAQAPPRAVKTVEPLQKGERRV